MNDTSKSLLARVQQGESAAWDRLIELYRPMICNWLRHHSVLEQDAEDLTQEIMLSMMKSLPGFQHSNNRGAFRSWLRTITVNRARDFWKSRERRLAGQGGSGFLQKLEQLEDPNSELTLQWDQEHDAHVYRTLVEQISHEFEGSTVRAFQMLTRDERSAQSVAEELGMSVAAVYGAKSRVLKRMRQESAGLLE